MGNYLFTLSPTFTQGLILGQLSILVLLYFILKYLFFDSKSILDLDASPNDDPLYRTTSFAAERSHPDRPSLDAKHAHRSSESAEWLNTLLLQVVNEYRCELSAEEKGVDGQKVALERIQVFLNKMRPQSLLGPIKVHSINLGNSAPRLSNGRIAEASSAVEFDLTYTDTSSISLSTSVLFNYPLPSFARLPLSLVISIELFSSTMLFAPPVPSSNPSSVTSEASPALTFTIPPSSISLNLKITSTMGSRAQLADVPKLHELIETQVKKVIAEQGTWKVVLPGLGAQPKSEDSGKESNTLY